MSATATAVATATALPLNPSKPTRTRRPRVKAHSEGVRLMAQGISSNAPNGNGLSTSMSNNNINMHRRSERSSLRASGSGNGNGDKSYRNGNGDKGSSDTLPGQGRLQQPPGPTLGPFPPKGYAYPPNAYAPNQWPVNANVPNVAPGASFNAPNATAPPGFILPPPGPQGTTGSSRRGHARHLSWSGTEGYGLIPPPHPSGLPPTYYPSPKQSQPYPEHISDPRIHGAESLPLLLQQNQFQSELVGERQQRLPARASRKNDRHRKSLSSSETMNNYGAFWDPPPPPTGTPPADRRSAKQFSPRSEILSLTNSFRANGQNISPLTVNPISLPSPRPSPAYNPRRTAWTNPMSPGSLPSTPLRTGGEALLLAQRRHRVESSRKMHMRQQEAQQLVEDVRGKEQTPACRDVAFLLLFVFHLLFIGYLGNMYGHEALHKPSHAAVAKVAPDDLETGEEQVTIYYRNFVYIACLCGPFAVALSALLLSAMTLFARYFVQVALMIVITLSFIWGTVGIGLSPKTVVPITGIIALALTVGYTFIVWDRIPFASANLLTALSGVHSKWGTIVVAFLFQAMALAWSIYYTVVTCGIYDALHNGSLQVAQDYHVAIYVGLGASYYWTFQVLQNCVQVTTSAVIGKWWHQPDEKGIVRNACFRTFFYYMGSICFGSLFVGPVRLIRQLSGFVRPTASENASLMCLHECMSCIQACISSCVDSIANSFNSWGFTYVGLYGYGFLDASHQSGELFERRGWTMIVSDDLVPNILLITSLVIGGVTGCFAHFISQWDGLMITSMEKPGTVSFVEGVVIGVVLTSVLFAVISSSVSTVIVCFGASPVDFEENHPELSHEMRSAWREVWPGSLDVIDMRYSLSAQNTPLLGPPPPGQSMV